MEAAWAAGGQPGRVEGAPHVGSREGWVDGGGVEVGAKGGGKVSEEGECGSYRRAPRHKRWAGGDGSRGFGLRDSSRDIIIYS